jgi:hypothetical protein
MAQIYGYLVCLVAVITFIICLADIIPSIMDLSDPLHAGSSYSMQSQPSLASFENYKMDILKSTEKDKSEKATAYVPDDNTLRVMYNSAIEEKKQTEIHRAKRSIMVSSIIILVSVVLFITHWMWMRSLTKKIIAG